MTLSDVIRERGTVPCRKCLRPHDLRDDPERRDCVTWRSPNNGHLYEPMSAAEVVAFVRAGGDVSH